MQHVSSEWLNLWDDDDDDHEVGTYGKEKEQINY